MKKKLWDCALKTFLSNLKEKIYLNFPFQEVGLKVAVDTRNEYLIHGQVVEIGEWNGDFVFAVIMMENNWMDA